MAGNKRTKKQVIEDLTKFFGDMSENAFKQAMLTPYVAENETDPNKIAIRHIERMAKKFGDLMRPAMKEIFENMNDYDQGEGFDDVITR